MISHDAKLHAFTHTTAHTETRNCFLFLLFLLTTRFTYTFTLFDWDDASSHTLAQTNTHTHISKRERARTRREREMMVGWVCVCVRACAVQSGETARWWHACTTEYTHTRAHNSDGIHQPYAYTYRGARAPRTPKQRSIAPFFFFPVCCTAVRLSLSIHT